MTEGESASKKPAAGIARRTGRGHVDSFGEDRLCAVRTCGTKLSRYNKNDVCSVHDKRPTLR